MLPSVHAKHSDSLHCVINGQEKRLLSPVTHNNVEKNKGPSPKSLELMGSFHSNSTWVCRISNPGAAAISLETALAAARAAVHFPLPPHETKSWKVKERHRWSVEVIGANDLEPAPSQPSALPSAASGTPGLPAGFFNPVPAYPASINPDQGAHLCTLREPFSLLLSQGLFLWLPLAEAPPEANTEPTFPGSRQKIQAKIQRKAMQDHYLTWLFGSLGSKSSLVSLKPDAFHRSTERITGRLTRKAEVRDLPFTQNAGLYFRRYI